MSAARQRVSFSWPSIGLSPSAVSARIGTCHSSPPRCRSPSPAPRAPRSGPSRRRVRPPCHGPIERSTPSLPTAETSDRDPLLTLESSDQLLIFGTIAPIDTVLGQVRLALADAPPAPNELLWERLEPVLVVLPRPLPVLEVSAVGTIGAVLWADVVTVRPREVCARPWDLPSRLRLGRLRLGRLRLGRRLTLERSVHGLNQLTDPAAV